MKGPIIALLAFAAVWLVPILGYKLYERRKRRQAPVRDAPPGDPDAAAAASEHRCAAGTFLPVAATSGTPPSFAEDLHVFGGIRCSSCERLLVCACGGTPRLGTLLSHAQADPRSLLGCCAAPIWRTAAAETPDDDDAPAFASYGDRPDVN